jgi:hypothetical protein
MSQIPIRMQSTLLLGLRGTDTHCTPNVKKITRWLRGIAFKPGNPHSVAEFMGQIPPRIIEKGELAKELEFCTQHYYSHLMHALEVVAYMHPVQVISDHALDLFTDMCSLMHLPTESRKDFENRLCHIDWFGEDSTQPEQPDNFEEAMRMAKYQR